MRSLGVTYGVTLTVLAAAVLARWLLDPVLGDSLPLVTLFGAVAVAVWLGGYRPALVAVILGYLACDYLFIAPRGALGFLSARNLVGLLAYLTTCAIIVGFGESLLLAQRRTHEEREMLRVTFTSIGDAVIATDVDSRVTQLNSVAESLTGWTRKDAVGQPLDAVFCIVNEQTRKPTENPAARALREGVVVGLANHTLLIARDGTERPIGDSAAPIRDADGRVLGVVLVFRDVTKSRQLERLQRDLHRQLEQQVRERTADLQASEERFRLLVDGTKDYAIFMLDPAGRIISWNPGAERIIGYTAAEILGRQFSCFYPTEEVQAGHPDTALRVATAAGRFEDEAWRVRKDGTKFWASALITALRDDTGEVRGFSKVVRDITDKQQAERNARRLAQEATARQAAEQYAQRIVEQREQLRVTLASIGDAVITTDAEGRVTFLNPVAETLTGWANVYAAGQPLEAVFHIVNERTREVVENPVARVLATGRIAAITNHTVLIALDGTERPIDDSAAPIRDGQGGIVGCVLIFRDVTARRETERTLRESERRFRALADALQEADRRKDEFLATLSHELRNPLAPIRNAVQILLIKGPPDPDLQWAREVIDRQVIQMGRLLDDLLDVSRISHGILELRKERIELAAIVQSAVETSRPLIDSGSHRLTVELPPEPVYLEADPVRLAQIISNLLTNAAKYTEAGGRIGLTAERRGHELVVSVEDDGIGITAEMLPRVFDIFTQAHRVLERSQGGLGIGLSLVRGFARLHGGDIEAYSEGPGKGSEFVVRLPIVVEKGMEEVPSWHEKEEPAEAPRRRLLIVDDLKDTADSLAMLLDMKGHDVQTAYDGEEAIAVAAAFKPEVVLLDIGMPKLNGYDACRHIREQPWGKGMFIVALTGWGQEDDRRATEEAGFDHHMVKPVDPAALLALLAVAGFPARQSGHQEVER